MMDRLPPATPIPPAPLAVILPELFTETGAPKAAKIAEPEPVAEMVPALPFVTVIGAPATSVASDGLLAVMVPVLDVTVMPLLLLLPALSAPPDPTEIVPALLTMIELARTAVPWAFVLVFYPADIVGDVLCAIRADAAARA